MAGLGERRKKAEWRSKRCFLRFPGGRCAELIFSGTEIVRELVQLGITHLIWIPDSVIGQWEEDVESSPIELVRICREGEAWPLAAGLSLGGARPLVAMQTTGLFESGDALRNIVYDLKIPVFAIIGARAWLDRASDDTARRFAEPILRAWGIDYVTIACKADRPKFQTHYRHCRNQNQAGAVLLAE